jgi:hypothetical protein
MLALSTTVASRYYNCCTDGSTSLGNYGKTVPKEDFCKDVIIWAQKNEWMTSDLMKGWLGYVWEVECISKGWKEAPL